MTTHDPYETLQVHPKADAAAIDASYRRLLDQYAPARLEGAAPDLVELAERKRQELDAAYALLGDPARRAAYDAGHGPPTTDLGPRPPGQEPAISRGANAVPSSAVGRPPSARETALDYRPLPPARRQERPRGFDDQPKAAPRQPARFPPGFTALVVAALVMIPALVGGLLLTDGGVAPAPVATATVSPADQFEALIEQARAATEQRPDDPAAWIDYGNLLYDSAQIAREQAPDSVLYQQRLPRWLNAADAYGRALELDPDNAAVLADRGASACFYGAGAAEETYVAQGLADTARALELAPDDPRALLSHGYCLVYARPPRTDEAVASWRRLVELVPADSPIAGQAEQLIAQYAQQ